MNQLKKWYEAQRTGPGPRTQASIAEEVGVQRQYLNQLMAGKAQASKKLAIRLSKITGVPAADIMFPRDEVAA